jgi:hypothetical protein
MRHLFRQPGSFPHSGERNEITDYISGKVELRLGANGQGMLAPDYPEQVSKW